MVTVKRIAGLVAMAALSYFAPGIGTAIGQFLGLSTFLGSVIGSAVLAAGLVGIQAVIGGGNRVPDAEAGKVNVRIPDPPRWLNAGRARQGGGALFGEFDDQGRFWYLIVHSDEILHSPYQYYLDDEPVTLDGSSYVNEKEFRLKTNKDKDPAETDGEGKGYVRIWTTTYSETDPTPPRIAALDAEFPSEWTSDHRLVGTTFSVVCMDALEIENRFKIYRWRGPFGMGEPAISVVGDWANIYDPRDGTQTLGDRTTYKPSRNAALIWAWFRTHPFGRGKAESSINWVRIAEQADICDQDVEGIEGTQKRYEAGAGIIDSKRRADAEREILLACDGQIVFDEDGKSWVRVGHWYEPTLSFSRNRDIMAMASMEAQDGESETQGVIVEYIDPEANYTKQPSAAWINPLYYDPLTTPKFLKVPIQPCQNHNQAMRLAKAIGERSQPRHKIGPTVNLRGLRARHERIVDILYDNTFAGDYEIATPVELDGAGIFTGFGAVPIGPSRWTLLAGEESPKPVVDGSTGTVTYPAITGENVSYSDGTIKIDFPAPPRDDATYVAEYILTSEITGGENDPWSPMAVNVNVAVSGPVQGGVNYTVRYRYVTGSGRGPAWEYAVITPTSTTPFSPVSLFASSEEGAFYDVSVLASLYQDSAGTIAVVVDGPVGKINDLSGNGHHLTQATAGNRPILRRTTAGLYYLESDGTNDRLGPAAFALPQPWTRISALHQISWTVGDMLFSGNTQAGLLQQAGASPGLRLYDGTSVATRNDDATIGSDRVVSEVHAGAGSSLTVGNGTAVTANWGTAAGDGLTIGSNFDGTFAANMRLYAAVAIARALTAAETANLRSWMAGKSGAVL